MDSLTQIALGAAVGEAVLGRKVGRKAALWGAVCGTLPDLDVLVPMADPVAAFTYHRSLMLPMLGGHWLLCGYRHDDVCSSKLYSPIEVRLKAPGSTCPSGYSGTGVPPTKL